jgi:hypothetical protein
MVETKALSFSSHVYEMYSVHVQPVSLVRVNLDLGVVDEIHALETSPGIFVLEAQPWSGYHNAMRKVNLHEPKEVSAHLNFNSLADILSVLIQQRSQDKVKITPDQFTNIIIGLGFSQPQRVGIIGEGGTVIFDN